MKKSIALMAMAASLPVFGAQPAATDPVQACAEIIDSTARLACFDRAASGAARPAQAGLAGAGTQQSPPSPSPLQTPSLPPTTGSSPPNGDVAPAAARPPDFGDEQFAQRRDGASAEVLRARIAKSQGLGGGRYLITLDNGQAWRHESASMAEQLREGEAVSIRKATLGSYRLTLDAGKAKNWVRVSRVR
jgi:hypothetical protein